MSTNTILASAPLTATGYHLKATGTTLGQSLIWDNGTNVGIGNTNTTYTLDVSGTLRTTGLLTISNSSGGNALFSTTTLTNSNYYRVQNSGGSLYIGLDSSTGSTFGNSAYSANIYQEGNYPILFWTNSVERTRIDGDGTTRFKFASDRGIRMKGATSSYAELAAYQVFTENIRELRLTGSTLQFYTGDGSNSTGAERMRVTEGGALFLGVTSGDANYIMQLPNSSSNKAKAYAWDTYSDERIKKDIISINYGLNEVLKLNPVSYKQYDSETIENEIILKDTYRENIGFIAQQAFDIIPEAVNKGQEEHELWGMDYSKLVPVLVKAIQEQQIQIQELSNRLIKLESK
jgi:hypothetical protein